MSDTIIFEKMALIGIGLIGSSIARSVREKGLVREVVCSARRAETREEALTLGIVDQTFAENADCVEGADLVVVCTPVGSVGQVAEQIAGSLMPGAIVSDVGSVKSSIIDQMQPHLPDHVHFVPAHPIAGTEHSGPAAGFASLFHDRWTILTPPEGTDPEAVEKLAALWRAMRADVEIMTPQHHDQVLAITSHIPHLIAYNIVGTADDLETVTQSEVIKYSAAGFRDFTRIAASDPVMWRDVFLHNREAVLEMLGRFSEDLSALQRAIRWGDGDALHAKFTRTRAVRRAIIDAGQDSAVPNFGRNEADED